MCRKKGNITTYPLILFISILFLIAVGVFLINAIFPFIWYQKLNTTAQKYMFVIEKFGYLTQSEKETLLNDLNAQGFDISQIEIEAPNKRMSYGEVIELKIKYRYEYTNVIYSSNKLGTQKKYIDMVVSKLSYSKI